MSNFVTLLCRPVQLPPSQKAVLMCLADRAHDDGQTWPSIPGISDWTCLGRTAVIEAVKALEKNQFIKVTKATGKNNQFTVLFACDLPSQIDANPSATRTSPPDVPVRETDSTSPGDGPLPVRQTDYTRPPDGPEASVSIIQTSEKQKKTRASKSRIVTDFIGLYPDLMTGISPDLFAEYVSFKESKNVTLRVLQALSRESKLAGMTMAEAMTLQLENRWKGFRANWDGVKKAAGSAHAGFRNKDYRQGVSDDGTFV